MSLRTLNIWSGPLPKGGLAVGVDAYGVALADGPVDRAGVTDVGAGGRIEGDGARRRAAEDRPPEVGGVRAVEKAAAELVDLRRERVAGGRVGVAGRPALQGEVLDRVELVVDVLERAVRAGEPRASSSPLAEYRLFFAMSARNVIEFTVPVGLSDGLEIVVPLESRAWLWP